MKSLQESLFDNNLAEKDVSILDFYKIEYCIFHNSGYDAVTRLYLDKLWTNDALKLKYPKLDILTDDRNEHNKILTNIVYKCLSETPIDEILAPRNLTNKIFDTVSSYIKNKLGGGSYYLNVIPTRNANNLLKDNVKTVLINFQMTIKGGYNFDFTVKLKHR